jgi:hypothetical protein
MAQFPKEIQAALLFDRVKPFELDEMVQRFLAAEAKTGTTYNLDFDTRPGVFYRLFGNNNAMITVEHIAGQAKAALFETSLSSPFTQTVTPDARERIARHRSHVLVNVHHGAIPPIPEIADLLKQLDMPQEGHSLRDFRTRLFLCGGLSLIAHLLGEASLVHWTTSDQLFTGKTFADFAVETAPSLLHIHPLLFGGGKSADGKNQIQIKTFGAGHFIDREIHLLANPLPVPEALETIFAFLKVAIADQGYIIPDGHTFGPDDDAFCYRVRHILEGAKSGELNGPLYQLELLHSRKHGYTSPSYIAPKRTFDDRNVPLDVLATLGEERVSVVQEWRAARQMAEGIGGQFRVKTEPQARGGSLGRWLPFGRRKERPDAV